MDWSKAKNILIIAFLLVNMFLVYKVFLEDESTFLQAHVADEQVIELKEQLQEHQVLYEEEIPTEIFDASYLQVQNYSIEAIELAEILMEEDYNVRRSEEVVNIYGEASRHNIEQTKTGKTRIGFSDGLVPDEEELDDTHILNREAAIKQVEVLIEQLGLPENLSFYSARYYSEFYPVELRQFFRLQDEELLTLNYYQEIEEEVLYGGYMHVHISPKGIVGIDFYLLEGITFMEESIEVIPAATALIRLLEYIPDDAKTREITSISFGYYTDEYLADEWQAVPVWRIALGDEIFYYINAFTGELEKEEGGN